MSTHSFFPVCCNFHSDLMATGLEYGRLVFWMGGQVTEGAWLL